jgi:hypothetical protein
MKEETKIELMKIAASLTHDTVEHLKNGLTAGKLPITNHDILVIFQTCLTETKVQFEKLG